MADDSDKSRVVTLALAALLGVFGGHRFYTGRPVSAIAMMATLGGLGIWWLYDVILIAAGSFRDGEGRRVVHWTEDDIRFGAGGSTGELSAHEVLDELDALRSEVNELAERVDFTERLLARGRQDAPLSSRPATPA